MVLAKKGDIEGTVVVAAENPMIRNLHIQLSRYPEIRRALETNAPVLVPDVWTDPLYEDVRHQWRQAGIQVPIRSVVAIPFGLREEQSGVFFLRTVDAESTLREKDLKFAEKVVRTAVSAVERAYALQTAQLDKARYELLATVDPLTGCLNRRALEDKVDQELERVRRYGLALSVLMIDLDHFKLVNDTRGHLTGDSVLRQVGTLLRREVRAVDAVARYGGEEFVVLLPETPLNGARVFAERIRERIAEHDFGPAGEPLTVTVSIGVATVTAENPADHETLIARADQALYRAKGGGRNLVRT
jgi:two-component system cell cycle response regulator